MVMDDLLSDFLTETHEGLSAVDEALLRLERAPDDAPTLAAAGKGGACR
jgi:two-component system chemotaxis sensor kinase CheA